MQQKCSSYPAINKHWNGWARVSPPTHSVFSAAAANDAGAVNTAAGNASELIRIQVLRVELGGSLNSKHNSLVRQSLLELIVVRLQRSLRILSRLTSRLSNSDFNILRNNQTCISSHRMRIRLQTISNLLISPHRNQQLSVGIRELFKSLLL